MYSTSVSLKHSTCKVAVRMKTVIKHFPAARLPSNTETHHAAAVTPTASSFNPHKAGLLRCAVLCVVRYLRFHALNTVLGIAGFVTVVFGVVFSVVLLPLCCLGMAVLKMTAVVAEVLAWLDVHLANTIPHDQGSTLEPDKDCVVERGTSVGIGWTLVSHRRLATLLYFLLVKAIVSFFSLVAIAWSVVLPWQLLTGANVTVIGCANSDMPSLPSILVALGFWILGVTGVVLVARISRWCTECFCAGLVDERLVELPLYDSGNAANMQQL